MVSLASTVQEQEAEIHRLCEAEQLASPSALLLLRLHIDMLGIQFTVYL